MRAGGVRDRADLSEDDPNVTIGGKPVVWKHSRKRVRVEELAAGRTFVICEETDDAVVIVPVPAPKSADPAA
jgi:hypothetical protein